MQGINILHNNYPTTTFKMLGEIINQPDFQKTFTTTLLDSKTYHKLLDNNYIQRIKTVDSENGRECYYCVVTKFGFETYKDLLEKYSKRVEKEKKIIIIEN